jgi:hypothetical protein
MRALGPLLLSLPLIVACRSVTTTVDYPADLSHPNYVKRTKAVQRFARQRDASQLPDAFALLMDPESHIRAMAHATLRDLTPGGQDFGYRAYLPEEVRAGIAARWESAWRASRAGEAGDG